MGSFSSLFLLAPFLPELVSTSGAAGESIVAFWKAGFDLAEKKKGIQDRDRTGRGRTRTGSSMLQDRTHRTTEDWLRTG